jgi:hypothetical protein
MGTSKKKKDKRTEGKLSAWSKVLIQGIAGAVLSAAILAAITWFVIMEQIQTQYEQNQELSEKQFQQDYDLSVAKMVMDVLLAKDTSLHPLLVDLLRRVKDDSVKVALGRKILANPNVSPETKDTIKSILKIQVTEELGVSESFSAFTIYAGGGDPLWRHIQIIFLRDDSISLERAKRICNVFEESKEQFLYQPEIIAIGKEWYYKDRWIPEFDIAEIRYNNSNTQYAEKVKTILDSVPALGKFKLNKTNIGTPPYSVLIILPDQTK